MFDRPDAVRIDHGAVDLHLLRIVGGLPQQDPQIVANLLLGHVAAIGKDHLAKAVAFTVLAVVAAEPRRRSSRSLVAYRYRTYFVF